MGNEDSKLSHRLMDNGFFSALGTTEIVGGSPKIVKRGQSHSLDHNNGVQVIYDEEGRPWIKRSEDINQSQLDAIFRGMSIWKYGMTIGAMVPHSNDGGHFVLEILPALLRKTGGTGTD
jgi:hypothetical protein